MAQATVKILDPKNPDRFITDGLDTSTAPRYSVQEVAKVFFGKSANWMRQQERDGRLVLDGEDVGPERADSRVRYYTLSGVEKMAHALAKGNHITVADLKQILTMVDAQAHIWKYK